jgi:hypothetical protein
MVSTPSQAFASSGKLVSAFLLIMPHYTAGAEAPEEIFAATFLTSLPELEEVISHDTQL